jgi:hypothetical protein
VKRILITIKTGSGQRALYLPSILFLIASESLNCLLATAFLELMYTTEERELAGVMLYAHDILTTLAFTDASQLLSILPLFNKYTVDSGLNINIAKTTALCISTPARFCEQLCLMGMATPDNAKHLGILLDKTTDSTVDAIMAHIEPKAIKRRIISLVHTHYHSSA